MRRDRGGSRRESPVIHGLAAPHAQPGAMEPGAKSTYERNHVGVKTGSGERAAGPDPRVETAAEFLQRCGVDASRREGDMADRIHLL